MKTSIQANFRAGLKRVDGHVLPKEFTATYTQDDLGQIEMKIGFIGDRVVVQEFTYRATPGHPEVTATDVRDFPLAAQRDLAIQDAAREIITDDSGNVHIIWDGHTAPRTVVHAVNKRRNKVNDENLRTVAAIIRDHPKGATERENAIASAAAYEAIQEAMSCKFRAAQQWAKRAKDAGLL